MLVIYNTLSRKKEKFVPINEGKVGIYVCGVTVYDDCHLGHGRSMVAFDVIVRFLRSINYQVMYVRNITDIDDKIIKRANELGIPIDELTAKYVTSMHEDVKALNILSPDEEPRATTHIPGIIKLIEKLIQNKKAYITKSGDVCFSVKSFAEYGKLSNKDIDNLMSGARVDVNEEKDSPLDFVLWKKAKDNEPFWESPWGKGRPGWHIECSEMALSMLGDTFDIHGGGSDLQFPHHENEIAQSEGATGKSFAKYWMHVGMLKIEGEKMSKSLGNFLTIKDVLKNHHPEVVRYFLLSSHYRSPLNYSEKNLENAKQGITRLYQSLKDSKAVPQSQDYDTVWIDKFNDVMNDDFNTPEALAVLFQLSRELNKTQDNKLAATLTYLGNILGILEQSPQQFLQSGADIDTSFIENLIAKREEARKNKDYAGADKIRDELLAAGIELEDTKNGTVWRKV